MQGSVERRDRRGRERLLRYCARPPFAGERLEWIDAERVRYRLPKPRPDGRTELILSPPQLIERVAALVPPPRRHRLRYYGVLAPNAPDNRYRGVDAPTVKRFAV